MRPPADDAFDVRCSCGEIIHTSSQHLGRTIRCRCGRAVTIARPAEDKEPAPAFVMGRGERSRNTREPSRQQASRSGPSFSWRPRLRLPGLSFVGLLAALERFGVGVVQEFTHRSALRRWASRAQLLYVVTMFATWMALITASEEWLPATLLAYGPRLVVLIPALVVVPLGVLFARRSVLFGALGTYLALHSVMGFRFGVPWPGQWHEWASDAGHRVGVRVVTLNAQGGAVVAPRVDQLVALNADVLNVQECSDVLAEEMERAGRYHVARYMNLCTASRWPFTFTDSMPRAAFERVAQYGYGGAGIVVRYGIAHPERPFHLVNLHLETPRKGLERLIDSEGLLPDDGSLPDRFPIDLGASDGVDINARIRDRESERASVWAARDALETPLIIAGDFNMPVESTIFRRYWSVFRNAFETRGAGFGYTKIEGTLLRIRIDHVLTSRTGVRVNAARVGPDVGSDHLPVIADLLMPALEHDRDQPPR